MRLAEKTESAKPTSTPQEVVPVASRQSQSVTDARCRGDVERAQYAGRRNPRRRAVGAASVGLLFLLLLTLAQPPAPALAADHNVIIVVIDGVRYSETFGDPQHRYIPNIWYRLRPLGTIHTSFYNRGETITLGAHASMLTGNRSWITWPPEGELSRPATPTLFEHYRAGTGAEQSKAWVIANHVQALEGMTYSTHPAYGSAYGASWYLGPGSDYKMWGDVKRIMDQDHPEFILINFHQADKAAHENNWDKYTRRLMVVDRIVFELWRKIQRNPFYADRTTLIVTNDHGRHDWGIKWHGDCCDGCQHVMLLALGPQIRKGYEAGGPERGLDDIAATAAWLMGLSMPYAIDGQVMDELFPPDLDIPPVENRSLEQLAVSVATVDLDGEPCSVFTPGETVGLETTLYNQGVGQVCVFQGEMEIQGTCHLGKGFGDAQVCLDPAQSFTDVDYVRIPEIAPVGEWPVLVEFRGLDEAGDVVYGTGSVSVEVARP